LLEQDDEEVTSKVEKFRELKVKSLKRIKEISESLVATILEQAEIQMESIRSEVGLDENLEKSR
jgi:hypothetical protein